MYKWFVIVLFLLVSVSSANAMSKEKSKYFISVEEFKKNQAKYIVLDARSEKAYAVGHIPGAINSTWPEWTDLRGGNPGDREWKTTKDILDLAKYVGSLGIDGKKPIVVYASPTDYAEDGRVFWELNLAGIKNVKMLDGGFQAWTASEGAVTKDIPVVQPVPFSIKAIDERARVRFDGVKKALKDGTKFLDVRSKPEFTGAKKGLEPRQGHLPGAIHFPFNELYNDDGTVMDVKQVEEQMGKLGITKKDKVITYCTIGIRSAFAAEVLRMAGYDARNYEGSMTEWTGDPSAPLEK